ncbi:MAG TPA: trypsin-like serine protease [Oligoflexus sp.]|uniref:trypsin-like serine protease n=1 Tax=Oligoflexus sp. TaxID=1971216 RepID=UPI002D4ED33D|nr:trypsin-like serine protease [Oligoflexus sp.]HYX37993.1 trypsin-like serine protease [Oligoflexus sp.]
MTPSNPVPNFFRSLLCTGISLILVSACGDSKQSGGSTSQLKVTNGIKKKPAEFNAVVKIGGCTSTFVSPTTLLTAAHCHTHPGELPTVNGVKAIRNVSMSDLTGEPRSYSNDLRVLVFPNPISPDWIPISLAPTQVGDVVTLAGFGTYDRTTGANDGEFRYGTNFLNTKEDLDRLLILYGDQRGSVPGRIGLDSLIGSGDSGGPLIRDHVIVGVNSFGSSGRGGEFEGKSGFVAVAHPKSKAFLDSLISQGVDIRFDTAGTPDRECIDVRAERLFTLVKFAKPRSKVVSVSGHWQASKTWAYVSGFGYPAAEWKDRPLNADAPFGSLLVFGKSSNAESLNYLGHWNGVFQAKEPLLAAALRMHDVDGGLDDNSGTVQACFE